MKRAFVAALALGLGACATTAETKPPIDAATQRELRELRTSQQRLERKLADLDTRLSLLSEKLDRAVPKPPPELDVVHLVPAQPPAPRETAELDDYGPIGAVDDGGDPVVIRLHGDTGARPPRTRAPDPSARDVKSMYEAARRMYQAGEFGNAGEAFALLARDYPRHDLADNAVYWQGMCALEQGEHAKAIDQLQQVPVRYPRSAKVPFALLNIGRAYLALKDVVSARVFLTQVVEQYPDSEAAAEARQALAQLGAP